MNSNKNIVHNQKHLTLSDRTYVEQELCMGSSFKSISKVLCKDPTTISKEVQKNRKLVKAKHVPGNCKDCKHWYDCTVRGNESVMSNCPRHSYCSNICKKCWRERTSLYCLYYVRFTCDRDSHFPYVCNSCENEKLCRIDHYLYQATYAQRQYEKTLSKSREGINMTPEELQELNELISPLVLKGQPLSHIFAVHADEIPVCRRTEYFTLGAPPIHD